MWRYVSPATNTVHEGIRAAIQLSDDGVWYLLICPHGQVWAPESECVRANALPQRCKGASATLAGA
jgi:hypothetical protein